MFCSQEFRYRQRLCKTNSRLAERLCQRAEPKNSLPLSLSNSPALHTARLCVSLSDSHHTSGPELSSRYSRCVLWTPTKRASFPVVWMTDLKLILGLIAITIPWYFLSWKKMGCPGIPGMLFERQE